MKPSWFIPVSNLVARHGCSYRFSKTPMSGKIWKGWPVRETCLPVYNSMSSHCTHYRCPLSAPHNPVTAKKEQIQYAAFCLYLGGKWHQDLQMSAEVSSPRWDRNTGTAEEHIEFTDSASWKIFLAWSFGLLKGCPWLNVVMCKPSKNIHNYGDNLRIHMMIGFYLSHIRNGAGKGVRSSVRGPPEVQMQNILINSTVLNAEFLA